MELNQNHIFDECCSLLLKLDTVHLKAVQEEIIRLLKDKELTESPETVLKPAENHSKYMENQLSLEDKLHLLDTDEKFSLGLLQWLLANLESFQSELLTKSDTSLNQNFEFPLLIQKFIDEDFHLLKKICLYLEEESDREKLILYLQILWILVENRPHALFLKALVEEAKALNWIIKVLITFDNDNEITTMALSFLRSACYYLRPLSIQEKRKLDGDLIQFLCELALRNMDDIDEQVFHAALKAILCVNLQFSSFEENPLLQVISSGQSQLSLLGNAIIAILNRGENTSDVEICLKFLKDLYSNLSTSDFFFINDFKVLIDIIIRQLIDLDQEDKWRILYLEILYSILINHPSYHELLYKKEEIVSVVSGLFKVYSSENPDRKSVV